MTNIARIEKAIADGHFREPVLRFRVYSLTTSDEHLKAGADFMLAYSADTRDAAEDMVKDHGFEFDLHVIVDGETAYTPKALEEV